MEPSTPELLTKSLDSVNMLSIQECLQPGLKCVAVAILLVLGHLRTKIPQTYLVPNHD